MSRAAEPAFREAAAVTRGVCRLLRTMRYGVLMEFPLRSRRRADALAVRADGNVIAVEVKSSAADYRGDAKWPDYREFCDEFFFAVPPAFPCDLIPPDCGLIVADAHGAAIMRAAPVHRLHAARRGALVLRFALIAAGRLHRSGDQPW